MPATQRSTPLPEPQPNHRRTLGVVFLTIFLDLMGFGILIPVQPFYAERLGASATWVTILGASFSLMQFLFAPFWGRLSDRIGRRPVMLISIAVSAVGYVTFGFATTLGQLFAARMLAGFGAANLGTAQAIIADSTTPENRARGMGIIGAAFGLGFIFGPAMGGIFGQFGLALPAFIAAGLCAINWFSAFFLLPETKPNRATASGHATLFSLRAFQHAARHENVFRLFVMFLCWTIGFSLMEQALGLFVEYHWASGGGIENAKRSAMLTTYVLVVVGVTATIVQGGLIGRLVKMFGEKRLVVFGTSVTALTFLAIPFSAQTGIYNYMLLTGALIAFGTGVTNPSLTSLLSRAVGREEQGATLGLGQSLAALGRVIGPAMCGKLFENSAGLPFWVGAASISIVAICGSTLKVKSPGN